MEEPKRYCENCGKEININDDKCPNCGYSKNHYKKFQIKDFILKSGRFLVDIDTYIWLTIIIAITLILWINVLSCFVPDNNGYFQYIENIPLLIFLSIIIPMLMLIGIIIFKYLIYLLIDIRDSLKEIAENKRNRND